MFISRSIRGLTTSEDKVIPVVSFYHSNYLVCYKAQLSSKLKKEIRTADVFLEFVLFSDPVNNYFPVTKPLINKTYYGNEYAVGPAEWHLTEGLGAYKTNAIKLFLVPSNEYPHLQTNFLLSPGQSYNIKISMTETIKDLSTLGDTCLESPGVVTYVNLYDKQLFNMTYSESSCYHQKLADMIEDKLNCYLPTNPWLAKQINLSSMYNLYQFNRSQIDKLINKFYEDIDNSLASNYCKQRLPCAQREYFAHMSSARWPSSATINKISGDDLETLMKNKNKVNLSTVPGINFLVRLAESVVKETPFLPGVSLDDHYNIHQQYSHESLIHVRLSAKEAMSEQILLSISFTMTDFWASFGGLLGLYLGCSLLTMFELVDYLHELFDELFKHKKMGNNANKSSDAPSEHKMEVKEQQLPTVEI